VALIFMYSVNVIRIVRGMTTWSKGAEGNAGFALVDCAVPPILRGKSGASSFI
jgi:hypothetical protein